MPPKRKHEPVVVDAVPEVSNPEAAAATIRSLIKRFDIDLAQFQDDSTGFVHFPRMRI